MKIVENELVFETTGKVIDYPSYGGYIGICVDGDEEIKQGYDSTIHESDDFTKEEREEFADFMIDLWQKWKET